jgi:RIO kinase 2
MLEVAEDIDYRPAVKGRMKERDGVELEELSDVSSDNGRQLSRSPPRSRPLSPSSLTIMTEALNLSAGQHGIKDIVSSDLTRLRARQQRKFHSKRAARRAGRPEGSKAKQNAHVKLDKSGIWD